MAATITDLRAETADPGDLFCRPQLFTDMDAWHDRVAQVRRETPIFRVDNGIFDPFWVLTRHEDVYAVSRDNKRWLNTPWSVLANKEEMGRALESGMPLPASLVQLDGQDHRDHRAVTNDWFKPKAVKARQPRIEEIADRFIAKMRDLGGECDFAADIAKPYTLHVIMDIYGVPEEDEPLMMDLTQGLFGAADPEFLGDAETPEARLVGSVMRFIQYFNEVTEDRRACPVDDLASVIANGEVDGCPMDDLHRLWYYIIVATAGHDTTSFALAGGLEAMLADPDQLWALRDDPDLLVNATDEVIRWTTPVRHFLRYATEDIEVGAVTIPNGERVLLSYPSANRDEAVFTDPMRFDVRNPDADKLLSFGLGAHFCLGSQFARREVRTMLAKLSQQLDHIEPAGDAQWQTSYFVSGVKHLPVRYSFT